MKFKLRKTLNLLKPAKLIKFFTQSIAIRNNSILSIAIMTLIIFTIRQTNFNLNAQSSFSCAPCELYDDYAYSCYPKPFAVRIEGATTAVIKCDYDYKAIPTGGTEEYTYAWTGSASSGGFSGGEIETFTAVEEGAQWVEVAVTDDDGCVKTERVDITVKKVIEYTTDFSNDVNAQWKPAKKHTCTESNAERMDSGMCEGSLSASASVSYTIGGSVKGNVDKALAEAEIGISGSRTKSSSVSGEQDYRMYPGEIATLEVTKTTTHEGGNVTQNMCDGSTKTGTWEEHHSPVGNSRIELTQASGQED